MEGMTKDDLRKRIDRNLEEIQTRQVEGQRLQTELDVFRDKETNLRNRMNALRDQVKKDLTGFDSGLTS